MGGRALTLLSFSLSSLMPWPWSAEQNILRGILVTYVLRCRGIRWPSWGSNGCCWHSTPKMWLPLVRRQQMLMKKISSAQKRVIYRHHTTSYDIIQHHSLYDVRVLIQHHIHFIRTHLLQLSCMRSYDTRQLYASVCDMCCMNPYLPKWCLYLTSSEWVQMIHFSKWALMYCRLCAPPHTQSECCKNCILCTRLLNDVIWYKLKTQRIWNPGGAPSSNPLSFQFVPNGVTR